jgi:hypothetical protein
VQGSEIGLMRYSWGDVLGMAMTLSRVELACESCWGVGLVVYVPVAMPMVVLRLRRDLLLWRKTPRPAVGIVDGLMWRLRLWLWCRACA